MLRWFYLRMILPKEMIAEVRQASHDLAKALKVIGLMNIQFAIKDGELFLIEVNPRASRTIPFVSKAIGVPFGKAWSSSYGWSQIERTWFYRRN